MIMFVVWRVDKYGKEVYGVYDSESEAIRSYNSLKENNENGFIEELVI